MEPVACGAAPASAGVTGRDAGGGDAVLSCYDDNDNDNDNGKITYPRPGFNGVGPDGAEAGN